ncbi:hypothetical protein [Variovorax sp. SRS16]|uniref:hypothetical protein n=1 Tax=Variovorax sp. SRS16 TaxID=282217 RepID=UPI001E4A5883|nr:hypothetical protein [Variovorax sp. SRS16]
MQQELNGESPRGMVLVAAAMLDDALRELLLASLVPNPSGSDTLFDGANAPLSTFSARIDAAYRLGLISGNFCRDIHIIRRIRNDVAHQPSGFTFDDPSPRSRIEALTKSHGMYERSPQSVATKGMPSLRHQFLEAASWMVFFLAAERQRVKPRLARGREFAYYAHFDDLNTPPIIDANAVRRDRSDPGSKA